MESSYNLIDKIKSKEYNFTKLSESTTLKPFKCGEKDLDDFLFQDAKTYFKYLHYTTYIIENKEEIVAYYSLANETFTAEIDDEDLKEIIESCISAKDIQFEEFMHTQRCFPSVNIGRLAINEKMQGKGYGTDIIDLLVYSFIENNKTGCQFITVDALNKKEVLNFYWKNGFYCATVRDANSSYRHMFKPLFNIKVTAKS